MFYPVRPALRRAHKSAHRPLYLVGSGVTALALTLSGFAPTPTTPALAAELPTLSFAPSVAPVGEALTAPTTVNITATKTSTLTVDVDGDFLFDPGDTIRYTITVANSGSTNATGVAFTDTIDANTTLVGGSVAASPVAVNDTFPVTVLGNVSINSANLTTPFSVVTNDYLGLNATATIAAFDATTANGGTISMTTSGAGMGQFTYDPPAGFEGTDVFSYTLTNNPNANSPAVNRTATVSITVSGMIWFVNNIAPTCVITGCGRLSNPFSTLAAFNALNNGLANNPAAGDNIFIYESATGYTSSVALLTGQKLIGQDATTSLATITGLTPPTGSPALPAMNSGNGTETSLQNTVTISTNVTVRGLRIDSTTNTGMNDIAAAITGVSVSEVKVNTTTGTGVDLSNAAGTFTFIQLTTAGGRGANLANNTGGTFTFSSVSVSSGANTAFSATGGGIVNVCDENPCNPAATGALFNILTSTTGTALNIVNTTIGNNNLEFRSISSSGGTATGIILDSTGSTGGLRVVGDGTNTTLGGNGSGGTIANKADGGTNQSGTVGTGIYLNNTSNVILRRMTINGTNENFGIRGNQINGFTLEYSTITGTVGDAIDEGAVFFGCAPADTGCGASGINGLTGSATINSSIMGNGSEDNLRVNNISGTLNRLTVSSSTLGLNGTTTGNDSLSFTAWNTGTVMNITVNATTFAGARGDTFDAIAQVGTTMDVVFTSNTSHNTHPNIVSAGGGVIIHGGGTVTFNVASNSIRGARGRALNISKAANAGVFSGTLNGNTIGTAGTANSGSLEADGIYVDGGGNGSMTVAVTNNQVFQYNESGIHILSNNQAGAAGNGTLHATVTGNTTSNPGSSGFPFAGLFVDIGTGVGGDATFACVDIGGAGALGNNFANGDPGDFSDINLFEATATSVRLPGYGGGAEDMTAVQNYLDGRNLNPATTAPLAGTDSGSNGYVGGAACNPPTLLNAPHQVEQVETSAPSAPTLAEPAAQTEPAASVAPTAAHDAPATTFSRTPQTPASGETVNVTVGPLPIGKAVIIVFAAAIDNPVAGAATQICNQGSIGGSNFAPVLTDDPTVAGTANPTCNPLDLKADLAVTKTDNRTTAIPGTQNVYTLSVTNNGPNPANVVTVTDTFPGAFTGATWTCSGTGGGTCPLSGSGNINTNTVSLPTSATVTFIVTGTINASATGTLTNTATTAPNISDPVPGNNSATDTTNLTPQADLSITKTDGQTTDVPGTSIVYSITVNNAGPSTAPNTFITDVFPIAILGMTWTCSGTGGSTCPTNGAGPISTSLVTVTAGGSVTIIATGTITVSATGTLTNTAFVSAGGAVTDPNSGNNSSTDTTTLTPQANVSITKTDGQTTDIPGTTIAYTITVSNSGPSNAPGTLISDTFPTTLTGVTWTCAGTGGGTCTGAGGGNINDTVNLPVGGAITYTVAANISVSATGTLTNTATATVTGGITDPTPGNNTATDTTLLTPQADLSITKTDNQTTDIPGTSIVYSITVSNAGPSAAPSTGVSDTFPTAIPLAGITWTCSGTGGSTCLAGFSGNIATNLVTLTVGGSVTFIATGTITTSATGILTNTAVVIAPVGTTDPTPSNNSATDTTTLVPQAEVSITKTDGRTTAAPGAANTYTITVANTGPSNAPVVTVTDVFPAIYTSPTWTCSGTGGGTCSPGGSGNLNTTANLPAGGNITFIVNGTISPTATGILTNTASITSSVTDPNGANNSATDTTTLVPQADLALSKSATPNSVAPGQAITFTLVYTNLGPALASGIVITDLIPATVTNLAYTSSGPTITPTGGLSYTWAVGDMAVGASGRITITGVISWGVGPGVFTNTATIFTASDSTLANNTSAVPVTVINRAPQAIAWATSPVFVGANATLSGTLSTDPDQHALTYGWQQTAGTAVTFNSGLSVTTFTAPATPGVLTFTLTVTDAFGLTSNVPVAVMVVDNPIAGLTAANSGPTFLGQPTFLTATTTGGTNISYAWNFGDGATALGAVVTHTYAAVGTYTATVTATNSVGNQVAITLVTVNSRQTFLPLVYKGAAATLALPTGQDRAVLGRRQ